MAQGKYLGGNGLKYLWQNIIKSYIDDVVAELNIYSPTTSSVWEVPYVDIDGLYDSKGVHLVCRKNQLVGISVYDEVMVPHRRPVYAPNGVLYTEATAPFEFTMGGKTFSVESGPQWTELNVEGITSLANVFKGISSLTSLSLCMDTSQLREIRYTFAGCTNLISLDLSQWNTTNVTNMGSMFSGCSSLTALDVSKWDTGACTNMSSMFNGCSSLVTLDVSNWDTSACTNMGGMFYNCSSLTSLDVSNWNTAVCTDMSYMFYRCTSLNTLDVSGWDVSNVTNLSAMFMEQKSIPPQDLSKWQTPKLRYIEFMFMETIYEHIDMSNFYMGNVESTRYLVSNCNNLLSLNLGGLYTEKLTDCSYMFSGASKLQSIDIHGAGAANITNTKSMFHNCFALSSLKFPNMGQLKADTNNNKSISLSGSPLDKTSLESIFTYDRTANGLTNTLTVKLSAASKALLTPEEIAAITAKGYTIT